MEARDRVFQRLKPICVALSESALAVNGPRSNIKTLTDRLQILRETLLSISKDRSSLDEKLADYVFFPISNVLKASKKLPIYCLELVLQCIQVLINQGWKQNLQPQLAAQLLILCTLLAEKQPHGLSFSSSTDELMASAFDCLHAIFSALGNSPACYTLVTSESSFPQLGQTISVMLDGLSDGFSSLSQIAATRALEALVSSIQDREIHASFLPGIVSKLTLVLRPWATQRRSYKVLIGCLNILSNLIRSTLSVDASDHSLNGDGSPRLPTHTAVNRSIIDQEWQANAATQLKPALSTIFKLTAHEREDVQDALASLCLILLRHCSTVMSDSKSMTLETLLTICAHHAESKLDCELDRLILDTPSLASELQNTLYNWLRSLVTIMQGSDVQGATTQLRRISAAYALLSHANLESSSVDRSLTIALQDSVASILSTSNASHSQSPSVAPIDSLDSIVSRGGRKSAKFASPLALYKSQEETMKCIEGLLRQVDLAQSTSFIEELSRSFQLHSGEPRLVDFWLLLTVVQGELKRPDAIDLFLEVHGGIRDVCLQYLEDLYSASLTIMSFDAAEERDRRLSALALRTFALRAEVAGKDFRPELVDALYPVLHTLATHDDDLQQDSIATLEIFASACGYTSVEQLIVQNADYLTNAIALKLNAFDVSPQGPQVLLMMLRLAGPSILPYLEDTIESIFAALEDFHGYPILVELLFKVLAVTAEEGAKTPLLAITDGAREVNHSVSQERWKSTSITDLAMIIRQRLSDEAAATQEHVEKLGSHPRRPWREAQEDSADEDELHTSDQDDRQVEDVESQPPAPKSYHLLFKITELTQHFLPAASSSLRISLLGLIKTTVPAIAKHENSFLPLINTLWPEVVSRLDDKESYVVATTLEVVAILCEYAGDFMRTRITQLWPRLVEIFSSTSAEILHLSKPKYPAHTRPVEIDQAVVVRAQHLRQAVAKMEARPADYADTLSRQLWGALVDTFAVIVEHIPLSPEIYDDALQMLAPVLDHPRLRSAFEKENDDAVWLVNVRAGALQWPSIPIDSLGKGWKLCGVPA